MGLQTTSRTVQNVIDHVKRQFGDESGVQVTDTDLIRWVNDGILEIATKNRILRAKATTDLLTGVSEYDLIAENVIEIDSIHVNNIRVPFMGFLDAEELIYSEDPHRVQEGQPKIWYDYAGKLYFWPIPDETVTDGITIFFVKAPASVVATTDTLTIPDKYYSILVQYVVAQAYEMDEDWDASSNKLQQVNQGLLEKSEEEVNIHMQTYPTITFYDY